MGMKNSDAAFKQRVIAENQILDSHTSSLAPAVDITFSKPASAVKGSFRTGLRFRKLRERGQSFLSRSNSNSSRNRKSTIASRHKNSILSSQQNDSSATALPTHGTEQNNNNSNTRLSSGLPGTQVSTNQNKGAADFQVRGIGIDPIPRTSTPSVTAGGGGNTAAGAGMTTPPSHRHHSFAHQRGMSEDGAIFSGDNTPRRTPRQRTRKLVRDPRNTHHMKYTGGSQSMDINPSHRAVDHEKVGLFTQLFSCCTPVTGMFKRGASYGSVRNDPRAPSIQQQNRQSNDNVSVTHEQMEEPQVLHGNVNYNRRRQRRHPQQGHPSVTDTAVGPGSAHGGDDDGSLSTTKSSSATPANEQQRVEEVAAEGDWLMRGSSANNNNNSNNDNEDYTSPGSGFVGGFAVPVSSSRHQTLQQQRSSAAAAVATNASDSNNNLPAVNASTALSSELSAYASAYSEFSSTTDAEATSSMGNSAYRTAPTSIGDITSTSSGGGGGGDNNQRRQGSHAATTGSNDSSGSSSGGDGGRMVRGRSDSFGNTTHSSGPSDTPSNTFSKLYLDDEAYEHVPRKLTVESRSSGGDAEVVDSEGLDSDDENDLRSEITSPVGNIATESSERLVTHVINQYLLPPISARLKDRKCLVLDLDETLVHSSFREVENPDYVVPVVLEGQEHNVYVVKRPGVDEFMRVMGQYYEIVVFTASLSMYADPVLDLLDKSKVVHHRLFRESCNLYNGNYVKDLSRLGRKVAHSIIIDNSPASYQFHAQNAIGISTWLNDPMDTELRDLIPFLIDLTRVDDVSLVLGLEHDHPPLSTSAISEDGQDL